ADLGSNQQVQVIRTSRDVQLWYEVALQLETDVDRRSQAHAVLGDRVVGFGDRLQAKVVQENLVPWQNDMKAFPQQLLLVEHGAAAEPLPKHANLGARDRHDHERIKHDRDQ